MTPCIIIPGFGQSKAELYDEKGNTVRQAWPLKADTRVIARDIKLPYFKTVIARRDKGFTDEVNKLFAQVVEPLSTKENGEMRHRLRAVTYDCPLSECPDKVKYYVSRLVPIASLCSRIGEENIYYFAYNAFDDPYDTAQKLDAYIQNVKRQKGCDKVDLLTFSMGGTVSTAYLDVYGKKGDIEKVFYLAAALRGSQMQSDILRRNFDKKQGYSLLEFFTSKSAGDAFRKVLALVPWEVRYGVLARSFDAVIDTVMMNSAGMWALLPPAEYRELADKFISDDIHKELRAKTDRFFATQSRLNEIITQLQKDGIGFYCACGYGMRMIELSASDKVSSDMILSAESSSIGATVSPRGETLKSGEILSPDKTVDAASCLLKDTTWFFNRLSHRDISHNTRVGELINLAFSQDSLTIDSQNDFPRFM